MSQQANLKVRISADGSALSAGLVGVKREISGFYQAVAASAAIGLAKRAIDDASQIKDLATKMGLAIETVQEWGYAAKQSSADLETVSAAFKQVQKGMVDALGGNDDKKDAFARMGISLQMIKSMSPEQVFLKVGTELGKAGASAQSTADALTLLGKSGDAMLPAFRDGFAEAAASAKGLGQVIDKETILILENAGDQIDVLAGRFKTILAPAIGFVVEQLRNMTDFLQIGIGTAAQFAGALSAGASPREAFNIAGDFANSIADARIRDNNAIRDEAKKRGGGISLDSVGGSTAGSASANAESLKSQGGSSAMSSDALARIGLFVGGGSGATNHLLRQQLTKLEAAVTELRSVNNNLMFG